MLSALVFGNNLIKAANQFFTESVSTGVIICQQHVEVSRGLEY
jgi:hypothetical protein